MKIAISSTGKELHSQIDPRFGRCAYFIIIHTDTLAIEAFENEYQSMGGGAGTQAANFICSMGVQTVLTGHCGPNAMAVFSECNIDVVTNQTGVVKNVIDTFKNGKIKPSIQSATKDTTGRKRVAGQTSNVQARGRCMGGTGRGMGRGQGQGMGRRLRDSNV